MTITASQAKRIETFDHAHSQVLDQELLYMVMNGLAMVSVRAQAWTSQAIFRAKLTEAGLIAMAEFKARGELTSIKSDKETT